ncbi:MAG TPA: hypothetical protein VNS58_18790 [Puia sp.]|nr:hypothetical protein [Puia sp.]
MSSTLNTINQEYITWQYEQLQFALLGGFRIEGMDRMRVTCKMEYKEHVIRHNLDLYNDSAVDKLIKRCAEQFSLGTAYLIPIFSSLINLLEAYRLEQLKQLSTDKDHKKPLSPEEHTQALQFLQHPDLLSQTNHLIGQSGVIGEENNRLLMYLIFTSRKRDQPLHIISLGSSGTGKSHLQEKVGELIPEEDKIEITSLSENAFYYFGRQELRHKLILIEDLDGAGAVLYPLRELQSKRVITKSIPFKNNAGETQTIHLRVEGPVCIAGCTTQESIYEDNANRSFLIYLDESPQQDSRIMEYQRKRSAGRINTPEENRVKQFLQNVQRVLQPITIRNPYAEALQLPASVYKPRRTNAHYLAFIEAITFYHQYQRPQQVEEDTGEIYLESTLEDIAAANQLMKEVLLRKSDDLTGACRNYFEQASQYLTSNQLDTFTNRSISKALHLPLSTVKRHNLALLSAGYLTRKEEPETRSFIYQLTSQEEYQQLQTGIHQLLDSILQNLQQQPSGSPSAHPPTEPRKPKPAKKKKPAAH